MRERVERPGRNRTTPLKADHCQPENKRLTSHHPYPPTPGERGPLSKCLVSKRRRRQNRQVLTSCGPQIIPTQKIKKNSKRGLYSTCASPVVPHPSTGHAHGCLASEIGRDPAFPTRFDRTVSSPEVSLLTPSRHTIGPWKGTQ